ncbi:MAG: hypothetical protein P4M09_22995 [Devosia sp.]|nr:hypothetical protein [Devosia sp.]
MPVEQQVLDATARAYVEPMTPIRGRRVHRLLLRALSRFDYVLPAAMEDGAPALVALAADGGAALCRTAGRGPSAAIVEWTGLDGAAVTTSYDLLKDSLPIVSWAIWHPSLAHAAGTVTIQAAGLSGADRQGVAALLRTMGA